MSRIVTSPLKCYRQAGVIAGCWLALFVISSAHAQSGSRAPQGSGHPVPRGSASRAPSPSGSVAMGGYCPVCIVEMKKWLKGVPAVQTTYDGKVYYFPGGQQRDMFLADPAKYVPALGGDCTVCLAKMGKRVPGSVQHAAMHDKRLYLFPSKEQKQEFLTNASKYADVDLAHQGKCVVCRVEMNQDVTGKPGFAAYYQGWRYLFPATQQRDMFLMNPAKYVTTPTGYRQSSVAFAGEQLVTITGKSGCAGCDHGVKPMGAPEELGLSVNSTDGRVYVVENAHRLFPKVYEGRFAGMPLQVSGKVLKQDGKFMWIEPQGLRVLN